MREKKATKTHRCGKIKYSICQTLCLSQYEAKGGKAWLFAEVCRILELHVEFFEFLHICMWILLLYSLPKCDHNG